MGLLAALLLCAPLAQGVQVPAHDGWVTDRAGLLSAEQERSLEALMESYRTGSGHEIAVLIVPDLGGRPIEELGLAAGRAWGIGREGKNDGALLLVARDEHALRIEVGGGLEGTLPDSVCGRIIRDLIVPEFKQQHFYEGIRAGLLAMHAAAGGDYAPLEHGGRSDGFQGFGVIVFLLFLAVVLIRRRRGGPFGGGGVLPWILASELGRSSRGSGFGGGFGGSGGGGFGGFGGGGGFSGGGASGKW